MNTIAFGLGMTVIIGSHVYMLNAKMPDDMQRNHALLDLGAAGLILYSVSS